MSVIDQPRVSFRLLGRSFLAFVLVPEPPYEMWLQELDGKLARQPGFFANRPLVLDFSGAYPSDQELADTVKGFELRKLRLIAVEGVDPALVPARLAPLPGTMQQLGPINPPPDDKPRRSVKELAEAWGVKPAPKAVTASLLVDQPVRSGQSIIHPDGDVTVVGSVASGAEIIAGGSIHIYGALRGRAFAGTNGNAGARIFCNRFQAEIVVIDGMYKTADDFDPALLGTSVQARLDQDSLNIETVN